MDDLEKYLDKQLENEEFKKEWEEFQPELQLIKEKVAKIIIRNMNFFEKAKFRRKLFKNFRKKRRRFILLYKNIYKK